MEKRFVTCVLALLAGCGGAVPAAQTSPGSQTSNESPRLPVRHALLVGCSEYPYLQTELGQRYELQHALRGPANDVELLRATLARVLGLASEHTAVLAGWKEDVHSRPTRANILAGLERLAREARARDQVILYLAGHGSQQRVQRLQTEEEPDGLEELFLPADARVAAKDQGDVPNSIRDDELGEHVRRIRDAGAEVWLIVDACHSGTLLRGGSSDARQQGDVRLRGLDPALLGVEGATRGGRTGSVQPSERGWLDGLERGERPHIAAFYGATSYGKAPEMELPRGAADAVPHGLFTYLLCQELERAGPHTTYRELAERVVAAYQAFPCALTVPTAEGELERELASGMAHEAALVCTLASGIPFLNQGRLAGLEPGVQLQLFELAQGAERAVARMEVTEAGLFDARGKLLSGELAKEAGPWRARAEARPLGDYRLTLALVHADGSAAAIAELPEAVSEALRAAAARFPILAPEAADWWLVLAPGGGFWLRPGPREGGFDDCGVAAEGLLERLAAIQKTRNLRRFAGSSFSAEWRGDLDVWIEKKDGIEHENERGWQRLERDAVLHPGEKIRVRLLKKTDAIYDVNVFYLDANFGVQCLRHASTRLEAGAREPLDLTGEQTVTDDALGLENVLVFATPRTSASREIHLCGALEQRGLTRGAAPDAFEELMQAVTSGATTRGPVATADARGTQSLLMTLRTEWGTLAPPAWPAESATVERAQPAAAGEEEKAVDGDSGAGELPDPWACGTRAALARSRPDGRPDLLLLGNSMVEVVLVDFDPAAETTSADAAELVRARSFEAEAAFQFGARRIAWYDRGNRGAFDLALEDADGDGVAEVRWVRVEGNSQACWRREAPVALPWLSQAYVVPGNLRSAAEKAAVSARLQALQGPP